MKDFLIQPEANNSVTLWFRGRSVQVFQDRAGLYIAFDSDALEVSIVEDRIFIKRIQPVTIEEMSGSIDYGGPVDYTRLGE
jgi:hypothetical protein